MSTEERFEKAVWLIRNGPKQDSDNATKLKFYSFYKQATEGDVKGSRPGMLSFEARAKWDAWAALKGMSKEDAMKGYLEAMGDPSEWEHNPALAQYAPA